jgi:hypothetical protein
MLALQGSELAVCFEECRIFYNSDVCGFSQQFIATTLSGAPMLIPCNPTTRHDR